MKFSYGWLKAIAGFKESPQKLAEFLTLRAFEVESVVKRGGEWVLDVKLLPNRMADASGHAGMAREIAALKNSRVTYHVSRLTEATRNASDVLRVNIENPVDCPRYTARVMTNVKVGPAPRWIRERLEACGLQAINNIVDAANYVMLETGQPLHVFDLEKLKAKSEKRKAIEVRRAKKGEQLPALDDKTYPLTPDTLIIADEVEPIAIAGIKGGKESGVSAGTKTIALESANFDPVRTRINSRLLGLKTDASYRFEHGMDPNETATAVDRLAALIQEIAGGEILAGRVDEYPRPLRPTRILLRRDYANRLVGTDIPATFFESSLKRLGWNFTTKHEAKLRRLRSLASYVVEPPTIRRDIQIEEDVIEEIVRLWGYEKIRAQAPQIPLAPTAPNEERQWENKMKDIIVGAGFTEAYVYHFIGEKLLNAFDDASDGLLEIANPTNPDTQYLNSHPARQYLRIAAGNLRHVDDVALFGIATGFKPARKPTPKQPAQEIKYLVMVKATQGASRRGSKSTEDAEAFYAVKGTLDHLFESLGIAEHWYDDALTPEEKGGAHALHPYRTAKVMIDDKMLGVVAEVHPTVAERLKAKGRLAFAQISFEKLWKAARSEAEYRPIGKYPAVIRDIAVSVPENVKADDVEGVIQNAGGKLLVDVDLFDYFQDEAMTGAGEKSIAFHLIFQSSERTLTDGEVNRLYRKIVAALKQKSWPVRE